MTNQCSQNCLGEARWIKGRTDWQRSAVNATTNISNITSRKNDFLLILASANRLRKCPTCRTEYSRACSIPSWWWDDYLKNSNGYFGFEDLLGADGSTTVGTCAWLRLITKHVSDARAPGKDLQYRWNKVNAFIRWSHETNSVLVIVFDAPLFLQEKVMASPENIRSECPSRALAFLTEEVVKWQDRAVKGIRDHVRSVETDRLSIFGNPDFHRFHELLRHAIHVVETLEVAQAVTLDLLNWFDRLQRFHIEQSSDGLHKDLQQSRARLLFHKGVFQSLLRRAEANRERLSNEVSLAQNLVTQQLSQASVAIASRAAMDGRAMRGIAAVTVALLPATFVATLFSTTFFSFGDDSNSWTVSNKIWVYWAVSVPLTALLWLLKWYL